MRFAIQGDFVTIDLKNSQPLILSLLFKNLFNEIQGNKNIINENYNNTKIQNKKKKFYRIKIYKIFN